MKRDLNPTERNWLEQMVDNTSVAAVLEAFSDICGKKAEHIRTNWQDQATAKVWDTMAGKIGVTACAKEILIQDLAY